MALHFPNRITPSSMHVQFLGVVPGQKPGARLVAQQYLPHEHELPLGGKLRWMKPYEYWDKSRIH